MTFRITPKAPTLTGGAAAAAAVGAVVGASGVAVVALVVGDGGWHGAVPPSVTVWVGEVDADYS